MINPILKKVLLITLFFIVTLFHGQNRSKIDSLKVIITNDNSAIDKENAYLQLSNAFKKVSLDSSILFAKKLINIREEKNDVSQIITAYLNISTIYRTNKEYYKYAIDADSLALTMALENNLDSLTGSAYDNLGVTFLLLKKNDKAIHSFTQSLKYLKTTGSPAQIAKTTLRAGALCSQSGKLDEALKFLLPLVDYNEKNNISYSLKSTTLSYLGSTYQLIKNDEKALYYFNETYRIAKENKRYSDMCVALVNKSKIVRKELNFQEALKLLEEAKDVSQEHSLSRIEIAVFKNLGYLYTEMKLFQKSYEMIQKAAALSDKKEDYFGEADLLCGLGIIYFDNKEYKNAEKTLKKGLSLYKKHGNDYQWKKLAVMIYESLVSLDSIKGDYKSELKNLKEKIRLRDSISDYDQKQKIASIELKYENQKKDEQIKLLEAENKINTIRVTEDKTFKTALIITGILLALLVIVVYNRYRTKEKSLKIINDQKDTLIQKNKENILLTQEIHHRVKNNLQIILSLLDVSSEKINKSPQKAVEILKESQNKIKSIAILHQSLYQKDDIVSVSSLKYFNSLLENLEQSYKNINAKNIRYTKKIKDTLIPMSLAVPIGLITNELITNSYKYAFIEDKEDNEIFIAFAKAKNNSHFKLTIRDNGIGMNNEEIPQGSFGLEMVKGLVSQYQGNLTVENGVGLSYIIHLKIDEANT